MLVSSIALVDSVLARGARASSAVSSAAFGVVWSSLHWSERIAIAHTVALCALAVVDNYSPSELLTITARVVVVGGLVGVVATVADGAWESVEDAIVAGRDEPSQYLAALPTS